MAIYPPPTEDLPIFDNSVFIVPAAVEINIAKASQYFLRFPVAQGAETLLDTNINGDLAIDGNLSFQLGGSGEIIFADGTTQNTAGGGSGGWVGLATSDLDMATFDITNTGDITCTNITPTTITDDTALVGTAGQVLTSTGTGIQWADGVGEWVGTATSDLNMMTYSVLSSSTNGASELSQSSNSIGITISNTTTELESYTTIAAAGMSINSTSETINISTSITPDSVQVVDSVASNDVLISPNAITIHNGSADSATLSGVELLFDGPTSGSLYYSNTGINSTGNGFNISTNSGMTLQGLTSSVGQVVTADATGNPIWAAGGASGWVGTATSNLNMLTYDINGSITTAGITYNDTLEAESLILSSTGTGINTATSIYSNYMQINNIAATTKTILSPDGLTLSVGTNNSSALSPYLLTFNLTSASPQPTTYGYTGLSSVIEYNISTTNGLSLQQTLGTVGQVVTADSNGNPIWSDPTGASGAVVLGSVIIPVVAYTGTNNTATNLVLTLNYNAAPPANGTFAYPVNRMTSSVLSGGGNPSTLTSFPTTPVTGAAFSYAMCGDSSSGMMISTSAITTTPTVNAYTYKALPKPDTTSTNPVQWSGFITCAPDTVDSTKSKITVVSTSSGTFPTEAQLLASNTYFTGAFLKITTPNFNTFNVEIIESILTTTSCTIRNALGSGYTFGSTAVSIYLINNPSTSMNNFIGITTVLNSAGCQYIETISGQPLTNIQPGDIIYITGARVGNKAAGYNSIMTWFVVTATSGSVSLTASSVKSRLTNASMAAGSYNALCFKAGSPISVVLNTAAGANYCMVNSGSSGTKGVATSVNSYLGGAAAIAATSVTSVALSTLTITNSSIGLRGYSQSINSYPTGLISSTIAALSAPVSSSLSVYTASRAYTGNGLTISTTTNTGYGGVQFNYLYQS